MAGFFFFFGHCTLYSDSLNFSFFFLFPVSLIFPFSCFLIIVLINHQNRDCINMLSHIFNDKFTKIK
jgi:hypothetical protein